MILSQTKKIQLTEISLRYDVMFERETLYFFGQPRGQFP